MNLGNIPNWISGLIGVVIGGIIGFGFDICKEKIKEAKRKRGYLNYLVKEMRLNYDLLEKLGWNRWRELKIQGYKMAEKYLILLNFPPELISKTHRLYSTINFLLKGKIEYSDKTIGEILKLLKQVLPEYEKELKNKNLLERK